MDAIIYGNQAAYRRLSLPFTAILAQERMKLALLLNAIDQDLGGVIVRGEKGTAKSTAVRALAALLPLIPVVEDCLCLCDPREDRGLCPSCRSRRAAGEELPVAWQRVRVVDLPLSATEDRLVGSLDFEHAVKHGGRRFEPGVLAGANRGFLYVDEINLLDDHLVDLLLDAAASGVNLVEREGISYSHPSRFVLVGTMNPEEGELRPQLLDRFGLCVIVEGERDPAVRVEIARRREAFDQNPLAFHEKWAGAEARLQQSIILARQILPEVRMSGEMEELAVRLCMEANVAGHRADLVTASAARALAAWRGRREVNERDVYEAAELTLPHRFRQAPPKEEQQPPPPGDRDEEPDQDRGENEQENEKGENAPPPPQPDLHDEGEQEPPPAAPPDASREIVFEVGEPFPVRRISFKARELLRRGSGRRSRGRTATKSGRYVSSSLRWERRDLALDATLRAAAPYQRRRLRPGVAVVIERPDFREKVRQKRIGNFLLFVVDASGSMGARQRMVAAKGAVLSLLLDAYQKRDRVGLVAFRGDRAEVLLPPTSSVERARKLLEELPTGGRTPLAAGLYEAHRLARLHLLKDPDIHPLLVLISDGRANASLDGGSPLGEALDIAAQIEDDQRLKSLVVDVESAGFLTLALPQRIAETMGALYYRLEDLRTENLVEAVQSALDQ
jgi:magnesium chelatase subunit D